MIKGSEIKEARKKADMTQEELADKIGYSIRQLSRFENDENLSRYNKFLRLLKMIKLI